MKVESITLSEAARLLNESGYELPELGIQDSAKLLFCRAKKRAVLRGEPNMQPSLATPEAFLVTYSENLQQVRIMIPLFPKDPHKKEQTQMLFPLNRRS